MKFYKLFLFLFPLNVFAQSVDNPAMYFPPNMSTSWDTISMSSLGWNISAVKPLRDFLVQKNTKCFIILVNGKIVMEEYYNGQKRDDSWTWNSAGKTLASASTGIAQQEGLLHISDKVSQYLGTGWTSEMPEKESLITIRNLLTMTSGIDDSKQFVIKKNLTYIADAGTRWAYGNVFQKLMKVVAAASKEDFESYFNTHLKNKIGMDGFWKNGVIFTIYQSTARSMARFGLLALNKGKWNNEQVINESFFNESIQSSQGINPSYGYLWWLNGKSKYMVPGGQKMYQGMLVPNAPVDMYAAMGAADQRIYVIPSRNMVIVRVGESSNPQNRSFAVSGFDNALWGKINAVINPGVQ